MNDYEWEPKLLTYTEITENGLESYRVQFVEMDHETNNYSLTLDRIT